MENSIVRGAIQGLIDDSKLVDKIAAKLDCKRTEILDKIDSRGEGFATIEEIKAVLKAVDSAESSIQDAKYNAEESYDNSDNCKYNCDDAHDYIGGVSHITEAWNIKIKAIEEANEEEDINENNLPKAPAKKLMNTYNQQ